MDFRPKLGLLTRRYAAYLIDCVLMFLFFVTTQLILFTPLRSLIPNSADWFQQGLQTELYTLLTISLPVWAYFAFLESSTHRATLGKRLLRLQVESVPNRLQLTRQQAWLRTALKMAPWEMAHLANNFPVPMWYSDSPSFRPAFLAAPSLIIIYLVAAWVSPQLQAVHDRVASTVVRRSLP